MATGNPSMYYVDPSGGNDTTGDGLADGTAWKTVQHALNNITRDATNGDQINIKDTADDVLSAALVATSYGSPTNAAPLIFRGYTSTANDGGVGGLDGNNSNYGVWADTQRDSIIFCDMHLHNCGTAAAIVQMDNSCRLIRCEIDGCDGYGVDADNDLLMYKCYLHDLDGAYGAYAIRMGVLECMYQQEGTRYVGTAFYNAWRGGNFYRNMIYCGSTENAISQRYTGGFVCNNTILSNGGSGTGVTFVDENSNWVYGNIVEGFSATGGTAFEFETDEPVGVYSYNAVYNCDSYLAADLPFDLHRVDNETASSSPISKSGTLNWANRYTYFAPNDVGNVLAGLPCGSDKGAVQTLIG